MSNAAVQMTVPQTMNEVVSCLGMAYNAWKGHERAKNQYKDEFFRLADEALKREGLAYRTVAISADSAAIALKRAELHNPGWRVDDVREEADSYVVLLAEDPSLKPYALEHEGTKYARSVRRGGVMVDDEWLAECDPELFEQVSFTLPWGATIMRPLETLDKELIGRLSRYIYNEKPRVALAAPRLIEDES